jgi:hypothetical protein
MEVLIELLLEVLGESLLQLVLQALAEAGLHVVRRPHRDDEPARPALRTLGYALGGALIGGLSLLALPDLMVPRPGARIANLVFSPVLAGMAMVALGHWRSPHGHPPALLNRFVYGYVFAFSLALVRLLAASVG